MKRKHLKYIEINDKARPFYLTAGRLSLYLSKKGLKMAEIGEYFGGDDEINKIYDLITLGLNHGAKVAKTGEKFTMDYDAADEDDSLLHIDDMIGFDQDEISKATEFLMTEIFGEDDEDDADDVGEGEPQPLKAAPED